jgi:hypothetical protein
LLKIWSGRVDLNHRPQRPERCALNQTALRPAAIYYKTIAICKARQTI